MDKLGYRIKFCVLDGLSPAEIRPNLPKFYTQSVAPFSIVKKWADEFKRSRAFLKLIHAKDDQNLHPDEYLHREGAQYGVR